MSSLHSHGKARFAIEFDNGVRLSFIWGSMTYSDNHDEDWIAPHVLSDNLRALGIQPEPDRISSTTVEIMAFGPDEFVEFFEKKYGQNPATYVPVHLIPSIMQRAKSFKATDAGSASPQRTKTAAPSELANQATPTRDKGAENE